MSSLEDVMCHVMSNDLPLVLLRSTSSSRQSYYSQPLTPPHWCMYAPIHVFEPSQFDFSHLIPQEATPTLLYNVVPNFISPSIPTHSSRHPHPHLD